MNISGTLTRDAIVSTTPTGKEVVNFSIAVNDHYRDKDGNRVERTTFIDCAYWVTAKAAEWLVKGLYVQVFGDLSVRAWLDKDGKARAGINFHTWAIDPVGRFGKKEAQTVQASTAQTSKEPVTVGDDDNLPF
ncbi:single-stranded DNA-binding protein [Chryseobacterium artocarpi]|uniref:Single-stranded DNA-binding protein n=1 Tax=Chryseobacterium artocarpi TaxID=1414727 RepID=A0A1B9A157_9FLAO|nr:single-stranded DNA-binding protein [Chryseobacterium artocarpi]